MTESTENPSEDNVRATTDGTNQDELSREASGLEEVSPEDAALVELGELKDRYVRALADMENLRRRHERERQDLAKFANEDLLKDFLPVFDAVDNALIQVKEVESDAAKVVADGIQLIGKQLQDLMRKHGLADHGAQGDSFDPNLHQAIQMVPSAEVESETIQQVYAKGYTLNGRVIRAAMVSVAVPEG